MGETSRGYIEGEGTNNKPMRRTSNSGSFDQNRSNLDAGAGTRFKRKHPLPSTGDRFDELTVIGIERVKSGACYFDMVRVQCSCGAEPHLVHFSNLRQRKSTRCNACAKKQSGYWRKNYFRYADVCPDDAHRRRLLNRLAACKNRCHNENDKGYPNYGGRGIRVYEPWVQDKRAFLEHVVSLEG